MKYRFGPQEEKSMTALYNISAGGILFSSELAIPPGEKLEIDINFYPKNRVISARIETVRMEKKSDDNNLYIGAKFVDLDDEDKQSIDKYVKNELSGR